jgi:hypothetical protein
MPAPYDDSDIEFWTTFAVKAAQIAYLEGTKEALNALCDYLVDRGKESAEVVEAVQLLTKAAQNGLLVEMSEQVAREAVAGLADALKEAT